MQIIRLIRSSRSGKAVRGMMPVGDMDVATLENDDYIIPCGTYPIRVTWSPKFKRMLPLVLNVKGRSGIRVHRGTRPEHSRGCILVSAAMEQELTAQWLALQASNEPIKLKIENENWRKTRLERSCGGDYSQDYNAWSLSRRETPQMIEGVRLGAFFMVIYTRPQRASTQSANF